MATSGFSRMASRQAAIAASYSPLSAKAMPSSLCAPGLSGRSATATVQ